MTQQYRLSNCLFVVEATGGFSSYFKAECVHPVFLLKVVDETGGTLKTKQLQDAGLTVQAVQQMMLERGEELRGIFLPELDPEALECYSVDARGSTDYVSICLVLHHSDETFAKTGRFL
jgi:hypothetical protein